MKQILQFFISKFLLVTAVSKILLIGIPIILYSPKLSANDSKAPFSISGNLKITHISDGDSLRSGNLRIRLFGIDAPEKKQKCADVDGRQWDCGVAAKKALKQLVESVPQISCDLMDVDRYSRLVMRCYAGEKDVAATLVREGLALAYRQYSTLYSQDENAAKISKAGMWSGSFTKPWKWRRNR
jgi:endonuclease YncB( thermonuclease family)